MKSGRVLRLRRGVYALGKPYRQTMAHPFSVANALKKASYVSLQSALAHYGMIPEYVPVTTSVTTGRPEELETPAGRFQFRHVASRLFQGFAETEVSPGEFALLASPYKALVDLLYLTPGSDKSEYLVELRLTRPERFEADSAADLGPPQRFGQGQESRREDRGTLGRSGRAMKPLLLELLREESDAFRRRSRAREYLQARILLSLQDHGAFANWAFVGGTALRFLFSLPRYSEDLDFSVTSPGAEARFEERLEAVRSDLLGEAYQVDVRSRTRAAVASALVKFRGLLYELGLSPHDDEVFTIKVEIDTNPPAGARTETRLVRRFVMLNLLHYDRSSLLAGKLHAVLTRKYTKGRDLYDLAWYLSDPDWPAPNLDQLNHALEQTGWAGRYGDAGELAGFGPEQARKRRLGTRPTRCFTVSRAQPGRDPRVGECPAASVGGRSLEQRFLPHSGTKTASTFSGMSRIGFACRPIRRSSASGR